MSIHASQRDRNVIRTILAGVASVDLGRFVLVPDGDDRAPAEGIGAWVRVSVLPVAESDLGRTSAGLATRHDVLVSCDVFERGTGLDGGVSVDAIEAPVEALKHYFTARSLSLVDYVSDPTGATPVTGHAIKFFQPPRRERLPPLDGIQRRMVTAAGTYFSTHTG